jgi:hypothetical protein
MVCSPPNVKNIPKAGDTPLNTGLWGILPDLQGCRIGRRLEEHDPFDRQGMITYTPSIDT